jgi:hypothetical protein
MVQNNIKIMYIFEAGCHTNNLETVKTLKPATDQSIPINLGTHNSTTLFRSYQSPIK